MKRQPTLQGPGFPTLYIGKVRDFQLEPTQGHGICWGSFRHYVANGTLVGTYPGRKEGIFPPALRLAVEPGDTVEFLKPDASGVLGVDVTWNVVTDFLVSPAAKRLEPGC